MVIRIFFALLTLAILGLAIASSFYILEKVEKPKVEAVREIREAAPPEPIDPGIGEFEAAMKLIEDGELIQARDKFRHIIRYFPNSSRYEAARRLCSEINLDLTISPQVLEFKESYEVQRGDAVIRIAEEHNTTLEYIKCVNGLVDFRIRPGDQLIVRPLEFEVAVHTADKKLILTEGDEFFAEYKLEKIQFPGGVTPPFEDELQSKAAHLEQSSLKPADRGFDEARKQLRLRRRGLTITSSQEGDSDGSSSLSGIFMDPSDIEELTILLRVGTPIRVAL